MKTRCRYIHFVERFVAKLPVGWSCLNTKHSDELGGVKWDYGWKQFVFLPMDNTEFSADCLDDISHFMKQLNDASKNLARIKEQHG
jgi:hypothetical protein